MEDKMKKLIVVISALFVVGLISTAKAENSATSYGGKKYYEQQVFVDAYNNNAGTIPANMVVIIDTAGTAGDSLGAYVKTTASATSPLIFGVVDFYNTRVDAGGTATIELGMATNSTGRIAVRGPHQVLVNSPSGGYTAPLGSLLSTGVTAGWAQTLPSTGTTPYGVLGVVIGHSLNSTTCGAAGTCDWVWIQPNVQ
jgi:hypothetical protein